MTPELKPGINESPGTVPNDSADIVLLVHGIRTRANWMPLVTRVVRELPNVEAVFSIKYGYFDAFRFWFPLFTRQSPIDRVFREIENVKHEFPGRRISIIAHSFGTYAISCILRDHPDVRFERVVLCGSIIRSGYRWDLVRDKIRNRVVNDYGTRDIWPILAKSLSWGYGDSGSNGFGSVYAVDRAHDFRHSDFFSEDFVRKFWKPLFADGRLEESRWEEKAPPKPWLLNILSLLPMQWASILIIAIVACAYVRRSDNEKRLSEVIQVQPVNAAAGDYVIDREFEVRIPNEDSTPLKGRTLQLRRSDVSQIAIAKCLGFRDTKHVILSKTSPTAIVVFSPDTDFYYNKAVEPTNADYEAFPHDDVMLSRVAKQNVFDSREVNMRIHNRTNDYITVYASPVASKPTNATGPIDLYLDDPSWQSLWGSAPIRPGGYSGEFPKFQTNDVCFIVAVSKNSGAATILRSYYSFYQGKYVTLEIFEGTDRLEGCINVNKSKN